MYVIERIPEAAAGDQLVAFCCESGEQSALRTRGPGCHAGCYIDPDPEIRETAHGGDLLVLVLCGERDLRWREYGVMKISMHYEQDARADRQA